MSLPLEHLSASSISQFLRCPRQWQENYLREGKSQSNSSLIIGSAVHLGLSRLLTGEDLGDFFEEVVEDEEDAGIEIVWKDKPTSAKTWATKMLYNYYENVGKYLDVRGTETEIKIEIPGVDIPILGYIDIETSNGIIDVKTTGYFNKKPVLNPEWKLQMQIYQMASYEDGQFHIITRSTSSPVVVPGSRSDPLFVSAGEPESKDTQEFIKKIYKVMEHYYETWGAEVDWPGNVTHPWAQKYCPLGEECCQK